MGTSANSAPPLSRTVLEVGIDVQRRRDFVVIDVVAPILVSLLRISGGCGVMALTTGCVANSISDDREATGYAIAVLNNVPLIVTPCLTSDLVKSSEGASAFVASALILGCGVAGAAVFGHVI